MPNVLTVPNSGIISFDSRAYSNLSVPDLSTSARLGYDGGGGINITSYATAATALDRFSVDGTQGRLFSVTDVLTGTLFSVNNITGLPILEVTDQNTVIAGQFNTNAFVLSGIRTGLGTRPLGTNRLSVSGDSTFVGTISTSSHGTSENWNTAFNRSTQYQNVSSSFATNTALNAASSVLLPTSIYQNASGNWQGTFTNVQSNSANWNSAYNTSTVFQANSSQYEAVATIVESTSAYFTSTVPTTGVTAQFIADGLTEFFDLSTTTPFTNPAGYLVTLNGATQAPGTDYELVYLGGTNKLRTKFIPRSGSLISVIVLSNWLITGITNEVVPTDVTFTVRELSGNWNTAFNRSTVFSSVSGQYNSTSTVVESNSATWNSTSTTVQQNSANWTEGYNAGTFVQQNSASWLEFSVAMAIGLS